MATLKTRIAYLEGQRQHMVPGRCVFESIEAAQLAGASGGVLIGGDVMGYDEWCEAAAKQQAELCREVFNEKP